MYGIFERFISYFGSFVVAYSFAAIIARGFQWALGNLLSILFVAFFSALGTLVINLLLEGPKNFDQ